MRYILFLLMLSFTPDSFGQKKNSIISTASLFEIDGRYRYKGYYGKASTIHDFRLNYYRTISSSGNYLFGGGLGYKKGYVNEFNPDSLINENSNFVVPTANLAIRMEEWIGRRSKFFIDAGLNFTLGGKIKTLNSHGNPGHPNKLKNSKSIIGSLGFQNKFTDYWNLLAGLSLLYGLDPALILNGREVKLANTTIFFGLRRNF